MNGTPKSLRLQLGFFGKTNSGKSTLVNLVSGQDVSSVAPVPGTTTDVVEKTMELSPVGPVVLVDTAGFGDSGTLGGARERASRKALDRIDVMVLVCESAVLGPVEKALIEDAESRKIPIIKVLNSPGAKVAVAEDTIVVDAADIGSRSQFLAVFTKKVLAVAPDSLFESQGLLAGLAGCGDLVVMVVPIDSQAPRGRLILPQVQAIRDALDSAASALVVRESEYSVLLDSLSRKPDLVICDSQVVARIVSATPPEIPLTTFSILMANWRGDIARFAAGAAAIGRLSDGDSILIAEACTHHAADDDIGRVKIPNLLCRKTGKQLKFDVCSGHDFPDDLGKYALVVHCGGCMISRREQLSRIAEAESHGVPITNYGVCISACTGVLGRALTVFPMALAMVKENA
ncbi:MAG: [FeFe] hydrogenase H-cluster maturation GTPase HydF [Victivallaceae bacterium]|nr:[FeFe] hydrogenase H-cluster maturation GTPase HydF [Victivallaceae bacterium]